MKKLRLPIVFIFIIAAFISCDKRNVEKFSDPIVSDYGIFPVTMESDQGGNLTCEDLIGDYPGGTTGRINYDAETDAFDADFSAYGLTVTVSEDTYVSFEMDPSSEWCVGAVIVKGGNASNVFYYDPGVKSDQGLTAPINPSGSPAGLSNITFCFVECEELVIAVKSIYSNGTVNKYCISSGTMAFANNTEWCGTWYLGVNDYPSTSSFSMVQPGIMNNVLGMVYVDENGDVTVTLNEGLNLVTTYLFVGTLEDLQNNNLNSTTGCPIYTNNTVWEKNTTYGNSQTFDL